MTTGPKDTWVLAYDFATKSPFAEHFTGSSWARSPLPALVEQGLLSQPELDGIVQIASFHPHYQFAGTDADDIGNFTNRAPYPTLHLLREDSVDRVVAAFPEAERIFEANMRTLEKLGHAGWDAARLHAGIGRSLAGLVQLGHARGGSARGGGTACRRARGRAVLFP